VDEIVNGIYSGTSGDIPPDIVRDIKELYRMFVYVNTTLSDYYILDTKDVPVGDLVWLPRFPRMKLDYIEVVNQVKETILRFEQSIKTLKAKIISTLRQAECTSSQILFLMEVTGLATTALDFSSLYPSIIEEFNLSIDKMIISSENDELYDKYVNDPNYKTIYCFYGSDNPRNAGLPQSLVGVIIAAVILLPEGIASIKAARKDDLQTSLNLSLGSALASIGLTIPAVAVVCSIFDLDLVLGLDYKSMVLLGLSIFITMLSLSRGKTNILYGVVLLVNLAAYIFTVIYP
jgi:Ca2+/Na+ antiporter